MLKQRIITALLLAPILLTIVIAGSPKWFALLIVIVQGAASYEWLKINQIKAPLAIFNGLVIAAFTWLLFNQQLLNINLEIVIYLVIWVLAVLWLANHRWGYDNKTLQLITKAAFGILAIMLFALAMYQIYALPQGNWWTLALFLLIWVADIGAYVSGKTMGKNKLAINISPGKTWEGVLGAQVLVAIYAVILTQFLDLTIGKALLMMIPIALFSVVGDLAASLGKRQAGVKDSSNLLPGHGGFIDRFDSLIAAAPLYYFLLEKL